jgi:hypothetical protein
MIPLYGFVEGDTMGLLVLVAESTTAAELAVQLQKAAQVRVSRIPASSVWHAGRELDPRATVAHQGVKALDRIDVRIRRVRRNHG